MYLLRVCLLLWVCSLVYVILDNGMTECECDFRNEFGVFLGVSLDVSLGVTVAFGCDFGCEYDFWCDFRCGCDFKCECKSNSQSSYLTATKNSKKIMKDQQVFIYCQDGEDESNEKNRKECGPNFQGVSITQGKQIEVLDHFRRRKQRSNKHPDRWCIYNHMQKR